VPRKTALVNARHVTDTLYGAAPSLVDQVPNTDALLLQLRRGDAIQLHLVHRYAEYRANAFVVPFAQRYGRAFVRQAPRLKPEKRHAEHPWRVESRYRQRQHVTGPGDRDKDKGIGLPGVLGKIAVNAIIYPRQRYSIALHSARTRACF